MSDASTVEGSKVPLAKVGKAGHRDSYRETEKIMTVIQQETFLLNYQTQPSYIQTIHIV